jgi:hypothetical protein
MINNSASGILVFENATLNQAIHLPGFMNIAADVTMELNCAQCN